MITQWDVDPTDSCLNDITYHMSGKPCGTELLRPYGGGGHSWSPIFWEEVPLDPWNSILNELFFPRCFLPKLALWPAWVLWFCDTGETKKSEHLDHPCVLSACWRSDSWTDPLLGLSNHDPSQRHWVKLAGVFFNTLERYDKQQSEEKTCFRSIFQRIGLQHDASFPRWGIKSQTFPSVFGWWRDVLELRLCILGSLCWTCCKYPCNSLQFYIVYIILPVLSMYLIHETLKQNR